MSRLRAAAGRATIAVLMAVLAALLLAGPADAHAELVSITPANGQEVQDPPREVQLTFTESVNLVDDGIRLVDDVGATVPTPEPTVAGHTVTWPMPTELADGSYVVTWRVVSADGHPVSGASSFGVGKAAAVVAAPASVELDESTAPWPVVAVRLAGYLAFALFAGVAAFVIGCSPASASHRTLQLLARVGLVAGAIATVVGLLIQGPYAAGVPLTRLLDTGLLRETLTTPFGTAMVWRLALYGVLAALAWRLPGIVRTPVRWLVLGGVAAVSVAIAASGHGAASGRGVDLAVDAVHALTASLWVGGLVVLVTLGRTVEKPALRQFSTLAMISVLTLLATGTLNSLRDLDAVAQLWTTRFGVILMVKLALVAAALAGAAVSRERLRQDRVPLRSVRYEAALTIVVLAVTASLTMTTPPPTAAATTAGSFLAGRAQPSSNSAVQMSLGEQGSAALAVIPATTEGSTLHLILSQPGGAPLRASQVTLKVANPGRDIAPIPVPMKRRHGVWVADYRFPLPGDWRTVLTVDAAGPSAVVTSGEVTIFR